MDKSVKEMTTMELIQLHHMLVDKIELYSDVVQYSDDELVKTLEDVKKELAGRDTEKYGYRSL